MSEAAVRERGATDIPASLLAPPVLPWWSWLTSDRAARYTARLAFLVVWQWAGSTFQDIPTPVGTIEFLVERVLIAPAERKVFAWRDPSGARERVS